MLKEPWQNGQAGAHGRSRPTRGVTRCLSAPPRKTGMQILERGQAGVL